MRHPRPSFPGHVCAQVLTGAEQGCNVIVWFAINIRRNATSGQPMILGGPVPECVAGVAHNLSGIVVRGCYMAWLLQTL
jgi:hypothetical protein